jgi:secreted trypsin-like serine protease
MGLIMAKSFKLNLIVGISIFIVQNAFAIMNGRDADMNLSAATVSIALDEGIRECTGVIIAPHVIITAGHCTSGASQDFRAKISVSNSREKTDARNLRVQSWGTAPGYKDTDVKDLNQIQNDFAYILVSEDLLQTFHINPDQIPHLITSVELLNQSLATSSEKAMAYGYGDFSRSRGGIKKESNMRAQYDSANGFIKGTSLEDGVGICNGDSGGGLFLHANDGSLWLFGVVSGILSGDGCGSKTSFAGYSPIFKNICWLQKQTRTLFAGANCP